MIGNTSTKVYCTSRGYVTILKAISILMPTEDSSNSFSSFGLFGMHRIHKIPREMKDQMGHVNCHIVPWANQWLGAELWISDGACF